MTAKERMIQALTDMLKEGETLMYPIYGTLVQGAYRYYGYFGFTDKFLLMASLSGSGKSIANTIRVPLDINAVKIKKSLFLNEHTIDIAFKEGAPCRIVAFPKVMLLDSQKENFPKFLSFLESKAPKKTTTNLKQTDGIKIRKQYFSFIFYTFLAILLPIIPMIFILECKKQGVLCLDSLPMLAEITAVALPAFLTVLLPLAILSLLNRYCFGTVVAVLDEKGIHLDNTFIPWQTIKSCVYTPLRASGFHYRASYIEIMVGVGKGVYSVEVAHFAFYGLRNIKKYLPKQSVQWRKGELPLAIFLALMPTVVFLLIALVG